jgi:hypothetical protein
MMRESARRRDPTARMNCEYEKQDGHIIAKLPLRMTQWYRLETLSESDYRFLTEPEKIRIKMDLTPLIQKETSKS